MGLPSSSPAPAGKHGVRTSGRETAFGSPIADEDAFSLEPITDFYKRQTLAKFDGIRELPHIVLIVAQSFIDVKFFLHSLKNIALPPNEALGQRLMTERKRLGLTQAEIAERTGVSRATVSFYESGATSADARFLVQMAEAGIDVHYVLTNRRLNEEALNHFDWDVLGEMLKVTEALSKRLGRKLEPALHARLLRLIYPQAARDQRVDNAAAAGAMEVLVPQAEVKR